ncbi:MAG: PD-(D/E)XK nuclease family protein, partial [Oscillospiraceae bacterium]|nr:PD-(D/E)XK nuclease family protein [Oscillospiraceae bacterium]
RAYVPSADLPRADAAPPRRAAYAAPPAGLPSKLTVTELKGRARDAELSEDAERIDIPKPRHDFPRPRFLERLAEAPLTAAERGTALHAAMQQVDFGLCRTRAGVEGELARLLRERRMTKAQLDAVDAGRVLAFVNSPLGRRAAASPDCRRELPFSLLTDARELPIDRAGAAPGDRVLLQGMIDLLFLEPGGWTLVDFKTARLRGRDPAEAARDYDAQTGAYARAVTRMTGTPVARRVIWFTDGDIAAETKEERP